MVRLKVLELALRVSLHSHASDIVLQNLNTAFAFWDVSKDPPAFPDPNFL